MGKLYVGQTALTITATVKQAITGSTCTIKYKKPNKATGSFAATITDAANGVITYTVTSTSDIDMAGVWTFWAYVVFSDGREAAGESVTVKIYEEGK